MSTVNNPFPYFPDAGTNGYIYIGSANQDAQTNPITVYRDEALTIPWSQPIRTVNGYAAYQGAKAGIFLGVSEFSITVKDGNGVIVLNDNAAQRFLNYDDLTSATSIIVTARDEAEAAASAAALSEAAAETAQAEAESARDAANSAAVAAQQYFPGARSYVPRGLTSVAITAAGSGGTNGTYTCPLTGDNLSVDAYATVVVTGGAVTSVSVAAPGLYIGASPTAGLVDVSSITGLTGATLTPTIGYLKTSGEYWLTDTSPASDYLSLFQNQANAAVEIDAQFDPMSAGRAYEWAEGTEPGGPGTKSAKGWAAETEAMFDALDGSVTPAEANFRVGFKDSNGAVALGVKNGGGEDGHTFIGRLSDDSVVPEAAMGTIPSRVLPSGVAVVETPEEANIAFGVMRDGRWIGFRNDGTIAGQVNTAIAVTDPAGATIPLVSNWDIVCWGTSLFGGADGTPVTSLAAAMPDRVVTNKGFGGRTSTQVRARMLGTTLTVPSGTIPADASAVSCTPDVGILSSNATSGTSTMTGTIDGAACTLTVTHGANDAADTYTIQRTNAGTAISAASPVTFIPDDKATYAGHTALLWIGRNNMSAVTTVRDDALAMAAALTPLFKRVLVLAEPNNGGYGKTSPDGGTDYNTCKALNDELRRTFGANFVELRDYMVNRLIYDCGITPNSTDLAEMADDAIPSRLFIGSGDLTHPNAASNAQIGAFLSRVLQARGY